MPAPVLYLLCASALLLLATILIEIEGRRMGCGHLVLFATHVLVLIVMAFAMAIFNIEHGAESWEGMVEFIKLVCAFLPANLAAQHLYAYATGAKVQ